MKRFSVILFLCYNSCLVAQTAVFKGHVTDAGTCEDIPFAKVKIAALNQETETDFDGNFKFKKLLPGKYTITLFYVGYTTVQSIIKAEGPEQPVQQFYITMSEMILDARDPVEYTEPLINPVNDSIRKK